MKQVQAEFFCKHCNSKIGFTINKPNLIMAKHSEVTCDECGTHYDFSVKIQPGTNGKGLDVTFEYTLPRQEVAVAPI